MKKLLRLAAIVTLLAAALVVGSRITPAAAADACFFNGTMQTQTNVYWPLPGNPSASGGLTVSLVGACAIAGSISFQGGGFTSNPVGNYCGQASLTLTVNGHTFAVNWTGNTWILTSPDGSAGLFEIEPDSFNGESCTTGANRFIITGSLVFDAGVPPVTTTSVTTTSIPVPLGGPSGPSDTCGGAGVTNENPVEITAKANTSPIEICVRAGVYGGKFTVTTTGGGLPSVPPIPTQDADADACKNTAGNTIGGNHPIVGPLEVDPGDHIVFIDAYASGDQVWVCAKASSTAVRLKITLPSGGGVPNVNVGFDPDTGTPDLL